MPYCGETSLVKHQSNGRTVQMLRCRSWRCPDCVDGRVKRLIAEAIGGAPNTFLTLTVRAKPGDDPNTLAVKLSHAWRNLRLRAMRHYSLKALPFIAIFEATEIGMPHLHILLRCAWIDQRWLSDQMLDLLNSPIVDIRRIDNQGRVAGYVAKYCGSAPHHFGHCKRYWKSRDYEQRPERLNKEKKPHGSNGDRYPDHWQAIVHQWIELGWRVTIERFGFARAELAPLVPRGEPARKQDCASFYG